MTTHALRVLLVDDSQVIRERLRALLMDIPGVEVVGEAADVETGHAQVARLQPDLLILDVRLPTSNGLELLGRLGPRRPVTVVLTNFPTEEHRRRARELGADHFFDKSSEFDKLRGVAVELVNDTIVTAPRSALGGRR